MSWLLAGRPLRRILVTRLRYLGDVVLATAVVDVLKRGDPEVEVGFLCESSHAPVLDGHPRLDRIHCLGVSRRGSDATARPGAGPATPDGRRAPGTLGTIRELRRVRYDLAVDLLFNPRSAWLLRLAGIPLRICGTGGSRRHLYTHALPRESVADPEHVLRRWAPGVLGDHLCRLAVLEHGPSRRRFVDWIAHEPPTVPLAPRIARPPLDAAGRDALIAAGIDPDTAWLLAAPGATWPAKAWPMAHWRRLLDVVRERTGYDVAVLVPPGGDRPWSGLPGALAPIPLRTALGVVGRARALVAVDGGMMHAAVAMGVPTLALFGPTSPEIWFPYPGRASCRVLATRPPCHPCDRLTCPDEEFVCLPELRPAAVGTALGELLAATGGEAA